MANDLTIRDNAALNQAVISAAPTDIIETDGMTPSGSGGALEIRPGTRAWALQQRIMGIDGGCEASSYPVTVKSAIGMEVIYAAMSILIELVGMTDLVLHRRTSSGSVEAVDHPSYRLGRFKVNDVIRSGPWLETSMYHALTSHGAFSRVGFDGQGRTTLKPLSNDRMGWGLSLIHISEPTRPY